MRLVSEAIATTVLAVLVSTLTGGLSGTAGASTDPAPGASAHRAPAARPLIEPAKVNTTYFSPNGDRRLDRAHIRFTLTRSARVRVTVRDDGATVRGPVRLGTLSRGRHVWRWDGRTDGGAVAADQDYRVDLKAVTRTRTQTTKTHAVVDTVRPRGQLVSSRPTVFPQATVVDDHARLVWVVNGWNPWEEEFFPEDDQRVRVQVEIGTPRGDVVWRRTVRNEYTPSFDWYAKRDGRALPTGRYLARVTVTDQAGNRRRASHDLWVSHAQLAEETWTTTMPAGQTGHYDPYFGGCNGCTETCSPEASERFDDGLSFRPCPSTSGWATIGRFGSDVPFPEAPVDSFRVTATGGPTTPGGSDRGGIAGTPTNPGDASTTTPWRPVHLTSHPFLPDQDRPAIWTFSTSESNSYDVATFTLEYRHYVPAA